MFSTPSRCIFLLGFDGILDTLFLTSGTVSSVAGGSTDMVLADGSNMSELVVRFVLTSRRLLLNGFLAESDESGREGDLAWSDMSKSINIGGAGVAWLGVAWLGVADVLPGVAVALPGVEAPRILASRAS